MDFILKFIIEPTTDIYQLSINNRKFSLIKKRVFFSLFVFLTFITITATFLLSILSTLKLGKLWIFSVESTSNNKEYEQLLNNYVYISNAINAIVAFVGSISAFFAFKDGYLKNRALYRKLDFEIFEFDNKIGHYYLESEKERRCLLIDRVFLILGETKNIKKPKLKEEVKHEKKQK